MKTTTERLIGRLKWRMTQAMTLAAVLLCSACGSVFDDEGDCNPYYFVRFVYDMNMLRADAFYTQVNSVDLYVFDAETGEYITHLSDKGEALASGNYLMPLDLAPGKYEFIAWCGLADNGDDFTVPTVITQPEDLKCTMARSRNAAGAYSNRNLHAVFHGSQTVELPAGPVEYVATVKLMKNTNNINLSLQHTAGALDPNRFEVTMSDENGLMAHDNSLLADEPIEYRPWSLRGGSVDLEGADGKAGFLVAELSTARLMANHNSRINIVDKKTAKTVFSIPIIQWATLLRSANHADMSNQEYLDREDEYNLMVFLTNSPVEKPDDPNDPTPDDPDDPTPPNNPDDPTPDDPTPPGPPVTPDDPTPDDPTPDDPTPPDPPTPDEPTEGWTAVSIIINGWHIIINGNVEF